MANRADTHILFDLVMATLQYDFGRSVVRRHSDNFGTRRCPFGCSVRSVQGAFSTAVKSGRFGTSYVETMLRVGESTGDYDRVLRTVSAYYGKRLRETSTAIRKAAEPLMLVLTGIVTGFLVTALLLPLLDMITAVN